MSLDADVPPKSPWHHSPPGELKGDPENSLVSKHQKYMVQQVRVSVDDGDPVDSDLSRSRASGDDGNTIDGGQEDPDSGQPKNFRTRRFRVRPDGVDPASLL